MSPNPTQTDRRRPGQSPLASYWWAGGLALHERVRSAGATTPAVAGGPDEVTPDAVGPTGTEVDDRHRRRLLRWRGVFAPEAFAQRLSGLGIGEPALLGLLAEPRDRLAGRTARPNWVDTVERVLAAVPVPPAVAAGPDASWQEAFTVPLRPFLDDARRRLLEQAGRLVDTGQADLPGLVDRCVTQLGQRLARVTARTFVLELNRRRDRGVLAGTDGRQRFADFVRWQATGPALAGLLERYPVLARLLAQSVEHFLDATVELLERYVADRAALVGTLLDGTDPGPLVGVGTGLGDPHRRGRSVAVLDFADGRRVVYKPRDLAVHRHVNEMVDWLNRHVDDLRLRT
ncbi:MAG TPA: DUF4135 domain-containing protein, partial [Micromonospora sp.]